MKILSRLALVLLSATVAASAYESRIGVTVVQLSILSTGLDAFEVDFGRYPTTSEGLGALLHQIGGISSNLWKGPYLSPGWPRDAWGHDFVYICPGIHNTNAFDLFSRGEDGMSNSGGADADDINNWDKTKHWNVYYRRVIGLNSVDPLDYGLGAAAVLCLALASLDRWHKKKQRMLLREESPLNTASFFRWTTVLENCATAAALGGTIWLNCLPYRLSGPLDGILILIGLEIVAAFILGAISMSSLNALRRRNPTGLGRQAVWARWSLLATIFVILALVITPGAHSGG